MAENSFSHPGGVWDLTASVSGQVSHISVSFLFLIVVLLSDLKTSSCQFLEENKSIYIVMVNKIIKIIER